MIDTMFPFESLSAAKAELMAARAAFESMKQASSADELRRAWQDFVSRLEKAWVKTERVARFVRGGLERRVQRAKNERRTDPLLRFLSQARHAEEHTLQLTAARLHMAQIEIPTGAEFELDLGEGIVRAIGGDLRLSTAEPEYILLPLVNRGVRFNPPSHHLGEQIHNPNPIEVALRGLEFYESVLAGEESTESRSAESGHEP